MTVRSLRRATRAGAILCALAGAVFLATPNTAAAFTLPGHGDNGPWRPPQWPPIFWPHGPGGGGGTPNPVKSVLATGLAQPKQVVEGPNGDLYVSCSGDASATSPVLGNVPGNQSGSVVRISKTGESTPYLTGLRSQFYEGSAVGPSGLAFWDGNLYVTQALQDPLNAPTGQMHSSPVLKVLPSGDSRVFTSFNALPLDPSVPDSAKDTDPYAAAVGQDGRLYVSDGGENGIWRVDSNGDNGLFVQFPGDPVVTGIAAQPGRGRAVTLAAAFFGNGRSGFTNGKVVRVGPGGTDTIVPAGTITMPIGVAYSPRGNLYVLQFSAANPNPGPPFVPGTGAIWSVSNNGTTTKLVDGLTFPTGITFARDGTAYVTNNGLMPATGPVTGEVVKITGLP